MHSRSKSALTDLFSTAEAVCPDRLVFVVLLGAIYIYIERERGDRQRRIPVVSGVAMQGHGEERRPLCVPGPDPPCRPDRGLLD